MVVTGDPPAGRSEHQKLIAKHNISGRSGAMHENAMSRSSPRSMLERVIDIRGVTPEPAERYNDFGVGETVAVKTPDGPNTLNS
jgi:hypothetical protein